MNDQSRRWKAFCCCGALHIEFEGGPVLNGLCSCANCRHRTGAPIGWSIYFKADQLCKTSGKANEYTVHSDTDQVRSFCGQCGTTLYWTTTGMPDHIGVAGGCFSDPRMNAPTKAYSDDKRCAWLDLPAFTETRVD